jgi:hypothetical protein
MFKKRSQLFIRAHNETFSVIAMSVGNEDSSPVGIHGWDATPTPSAAGSASWFRQKSECVLALKVKL